MADVEIRSPDDGQVVGRVRQAILSRVSRRIRGAGCKMGGKDSGLEREDGRYAIAEIAKPRGCSCVVYDAECMPGHGVRAML